MHAIGKNGSTYVGKFMKILPPTGTPAYNSRLIEKVVFWATKRFVEVILRILISPGVLLSTIKPEESSAILQVAQLLWAVVYW